MAANDPSSPIRQSAAASVAALVTAGGTLVCCVLPAMMVSLGAGAALAGLVTAVPQLIWLSVHKGLVFGAATAALVVAGALLYRARAAPCPADPALARTCQRLRRTSDVLYRVAVVATLLGALFAFALPALMA